MSMRLIRICGSIAFALLITLVGCGNGNGSSGADDAGDASLTQEEGETVTETDPIVAYLEAAQQNDIEKVQAFVEEGGDVNVADEKKRTALIYASRKGHIDVITYLLSKGADANLRDSENLTAIAYAAQSGNLEVAKALVETGAELSVTSGLDQNLVILATFGGNPDLVAYFIEQGVAKDEADADGKTALEYAEEYGMDAIKEVLQ